MTKKTIFNFLATAMFCGCAMFMLASCSSSEDNPASQQSTDIVAPAQLKQGIWTEYDTVLVASGKKTMEELAEMPAVGMMVDGDKAYFFTYTAEGASDLVEGKISYDKSTGKGNITFPAIKDNPLSGQTVNFTATSDETLEFELTYEGQKTTATCAWLCENLDDWNTEITDEDWKELMAYYQTIDENAGPDPTIDWSDSDVEGLDKPLEWSEDALAPARTRAIAVGTVIKTGLNIFSALFKEDPNEKINGKLDAIMGKLDNVLANQQTIINQLNQVNERLIAIAQKLKQTEIVNMFNNRNEKYYNKLKVRNNSYFAEAYEKYKANKNDPELGDYAKAWVGKNEEYVSLTWEYIEYLTTVEHTDYGKGMAAIYDGLTFDKYPWEHMGIGDRKAYRAYDLDMIAKCLFMISLYSTYGGLNNVEKKGLYNSYDAYKPQLKEFSEFNVTNPDEFLVCQIKGAHFVMRKEIQLYNYIGKNNEAPDPAVYGLDAMYRPMWHEAGSPKIENPEELKSKLIHMSEMSAICDYYTKRERLSWMNMLVDGKKAPGAVLAKNLTDPEANLLLFNHMSPHNNGSRVDNTMREEGPVLVMYSIMNSDYPVEWQAIGFVNDHKWTRVPPKQYYAAIVEKHF